MCKSLYLKKNCTLYNITFSIKLKNKKKTTLILTWDFKKCDNHAAKREALSESVRDAVLFLAKDFRDDKEIIEEENFPLMDPRSLLFMYVRYLVQSTVTNETSMGQSHVRLLANDGRLDFHHLGDMVRAGLKLVGFDAVVDAGEDVLVDVAAIVDAPQVLHKVVEAHALLRLEVRRVQIGVEHDDCEREHEYRVGRAQPGYHVRIALTVPLTEHFHQTLDLLRLAGHPEVRLEFAQGHVHLHARQVQLLREASKNTTHNQVRLIRSL